MRKRRISEQGSVTAELAVTLPALTAILALLLVGAVVGVTQLRLEEAARAGARAAARGETSATVVSTARRIAGPSAEVDISLGAQWSRVQVTARVEGPLAGLVSWPLVAEAVTKRESSYATAGVTGAARAISPGAGHAVRCPVPAGSPREVGDAAIPVMTGAA